MDSASTTRRPSIVVVMGVSGCGKSLVGAALAKAMGAAFAEGDSYHPAANIARMSSGLALRDEDRWGWLDAIADEIAEADRNGRALVVTCSALKRAYRDRLRLASPHMRFVYLDVGRDVAASRVAGRKGHFMPASLIDSQFAALEPPDADEKAIALDAMRDPDELVAEVICALAGELPASQT
jgi:gluconokinase